MKFISIQCLTLIVALTNHTRSFASDIIPPNAPENGVNAVNPLNVGNGPAITLKGRVLERGTRLPLSNVPVFILPSKKKVITDGSGMFEFTDVPEGDSKWVVNLAGYLRYEKSVVVNKELSDSTVKLYVEKSNYDVQGVTVYGKQAKRDDRTKSLRAEQFLKLPGSGGDPIKSVQNLPGINRPQSFNSQVIIEGSAPQDTQYLIEGIEVPIIFHFGGLSSVVFPEALERVDTLNAGFGPEQSRALGGAVSVYSRAPRSDRLHGLGFADLMNAGALVEGPITERSRFLIGARQSYIGAVLKLFVKNTSSFNFTLAPSFSDLVFIYDHDVTPKDDFRLTTVGSYDRLEFLFKQPIGQDPGIRGTFSNETAFFRLIPQWTHRHSKKSISKFSLGIGKDWIRFDFGSGLFHLQTVSTSVRFDHERKWTDFLSSFFGIDNQYTRGQVDIDAPIMNNNGGVQTPLASAEYRRQSVTSKYTQLGLYNRNNIELDQKHYTITPGGRLDYFSQTSEIILEPRLSFKYAIHGLEALKFRSNLGTYAQPPEPQETDTVYGNPDIVSPRSVHYTIGFESDFKGDSSKGFDLSSDVFYKNLYRLPVRSSALIIRNGTLTPENYNQSGSGRVYGLSSQLKADFAPVTGWISYTLSKSYRTSGSAAERLFQYDQTHLLTTVLQWELPENITFGFRFRYTTGNPYTPIAGSIYDADADVYAPVAGAFYSERMPPFYALDFRADKKWIFDSWIFSAYLDLQNVTNRKNVEAYRYSYNYSQKESISLLPFVGTLGLKGEF